MNIFEFVLTGLTLVLALVLTRLLGSLRWVFNGDRRYWVHALLVCNLLLLCTLIWWGLWYLRDAQWGYIAFTYNLLVGPGIFFVLASTLVPDTPRRVRDWESYYYSIHRMFWGTMAILVVVMFIGSLAFTGTPVFHPTRVIQSIALVLSLTGMLSPNRTLHGVLAVGMAITVMAAVVLSARAPS